MLDLYTWGTPNGRKVSIMLEELALDYNVISINIGKDDQMTPEFLALNHNHKIPVLVDKSQNPEIVLAESGAILIYLAEKHGKFLPTDVHKRAEVMQWLMFQMGGFGPILGQGHHFLKYNPGHGEYAENRFRNEIQRLYGVLNQQLEGQHYVAGDYSIADMAMYPWAARHEWHQIDLGDFPAVKAWFDRLSDRSAVSRGMEVPFFN